MSSYMAEGCSSVSPYIVVKDAQKSIDFYVKAFSGVGGSCMKAPDGSVMHGEVRIGNSCVMLSQENPNWPQMKSAETLGGSPIGLHVYVEDADSAFQQAIAAGCTEVQPVADMFWGDRYGKVKDPFGIEWGLATQKEKLTEEELHQRGQEWFAKMAQQQGQ